MSLNDNNTPERGPGPTVWEEGGPGFGIVKLCGPSASDKAGAAVVVGHPGCDNHSPSAGEHAGRQDIMVAWVESALGTASAVGRVMVQRFCLDGAAQPIPAPANDNPAWVSDGRGVGAVGCDPTLATLQTGETLLAWIGADGLAHARLYAPDSAGSSAGAGVDAPEYAAVNAALADLGPVVPTAELDRRLQVLETRPGSFAIMWLALADSGLVLRGSLFSAPPEARLEDAAASWSHRSIADISLPRSFAGQYRLEVAAAESADVIVTYATVDAVAHSIDVLARQIDAADFDGNAAPPGTEHLVASMSADADESRSGPVRAEAEGEAVLHLTTGPGREGDEDSLAPAVTGGGWAPIIAAGSDGFVVAWETVVAEGVAVITLAMFDPDGDAGPVIEVTDKAQAGFPPAIAHLSQGGAAVGYMSADKHDLIVKAFDDTGEQIGHEVVVDVGEKGPIFEIAIAPLHLDEEAAAYANQLVVVYVRDGASDKDNGGTRSLEAGGDPYGWIMLQRYGVATASDDQPAGLVALGGDGQHDGADAPVQMAADNDGDGVAEVGAVGRAPTLAGLSDGDVAVVWVERYGAGETIRGGVLRPDGEQVLFVDLTGLLDGAGIAKGTKPTLLDTGDGDLIVGWLQPDGDGFVLMAAVYEAVGTGQWVEPEGSLRLQEFDSEPAAFSISVSEEDGAFLTATWRSDSSGSGSGKIYSQRYDPDGNSLGKPVKVAGDEMRAGDQLSSQTLGAAGLLDGQIVVVYAEHGQDGAVDVAAQVIDARNLAAGYEDSGAAQGETAAFATSVDQEVAIDVLAGAAYGSTLARINGVPITEAAPVDVGSGWVQLREDGSLTVSPDEGFSGAIAFGYTIADGATGLEREGRAVVDVAHPSLSLDEQVTSLSEDASTAADIKVADIEAEDLLSTEALSLVGLDANMFKLVGTTLYLKAGIELDFDTKPALSVEVHAGLASDGGDGVHFSLNIEQSLHDDMAGSHALADTFVFAPDLAAASNHPPRANDGHEIIDLSSSGYTTFQELLDAGAVVQAGDDVVITFDPDDPANSDRLTLRGIDLSHLSGDDFKF